MLNIIIIPVIRFNFAMYYLYIRKSLPMKPLLLRILSCALLCSFFFIGKSYGQLCPNNQPYSTETRDSILIGNGHDTYSLPQFDPSRGTLYSVHITAQIFFFYNFSLENNSGFEQDYTVTVKRKDLLKASSPNNPTPVNLLPNVFQNTDFYYETVPVGISNYNEVVYNPKIIDTLVANDVIPFLGNDSLYLKYSTQTLDGGLGDSRISPINKQPYDSLRFSITYNYCPSAALPSTFIKLTAQPQNSNILLAWTSQQILSGGSFELLKSIDGRTYISVNKQDVNSNSLAGYNYLYKPTAKDPSKAFFRIKQTDQNGNITYSKVITVILPTNNNRGSVEEGTEKNLVVYPTIPTGNFINVFIPSGTNTDEWAISIISLAGRVMQQSKFSKTNLARVDFTNPLAPGMYIVDAYNTRTQEHFKDKIVVQH